MIFREIRVTRGRKRNAGVISDNGHSKNSPTEAACFESRPRRRVFLLVTPFAIAYTRQEFNDIKG